MDTILLISSALACVGFIILFYVRWFKEDKFTKFTAVGAILFIQAFIVFAATGITNSSKQDEALKELKQFLKQDSLRVKIDDEFLDSLSTIKILGAIRSVKDIKAHHSHPVNTIDIQIFVSNNTKPVHLSLSKDSQRPNEYWVFWPAYSNENEVGRIQTEENVRFTKD